eukprot:g2052.t1
MSDLQPPDLLRLGDEHVRRQWMVTNGADSKEADKWFKDQLINKLEKQYNRKIRDVPQSKLPFLVRQSLTAGVTYLRQAESIKHLQSKRAKEKEHRRFDRGFRGTEGFVETLKGKYINSIRGWRIAFKDDVLEPVGFAQFMNGCRKIGYIGNVKSLWNHLLSQPDPIRGSSGSGDDHFSGGHGQHSQHQSRSRAGAINNQPVRQTISFFDVDPLSVRKLHSFACMVEDSGREEGGLNFAQLWSKYANAGGAMRYETFYEFFCSCAETFNRNRTAAKFQDSRPGTNPKACVRTRPRSLVACTNVCFGIEFYEHPATGVERHELICPAVSDRVEAWHVAPPLPELSLNAEVADRIDSFAHTDGVLGKLHSLTLCCSGFDIVLQRDHHAIIKELHGFDAFTLFPPESSPDRYDPSLPLAVRNSSPPLTGILCCCYEMRAPDGGIAWLPRMSSGVDGRVPAVEACVCQYPVAYGFAMPVHAA